MQGVTVDAGAAEGIATFHPFPQPLAGCTLGVGQALLGFNSQHTSDGLAASGNDDFGALLDMFQVAGQVLNGRVADQRGSPLMSGLREIAEIHQGDFRITPNKNLIVAGIPQDQRTRIEVIARSHGLLAEAKTPIRLAGIACVALPTCPLAMAEVERTFRALLDQVERLADTHGIGDTGIVMRMTGCPNGCARPYVAEIALIGKGPGRYNLLLGGDGKGARLNRLFRENLAEAAISSARASASRPP